jgi:glucosamine-6-phosphate deaminase
MVETNIPAASRKLEAIISENLQTICGKKVYRGHAAEYTPTVWAVRRAVQQGKFGPKDLLRPKAHWHPDFSVDLADNIEQHNYKFAIRIFSKLVEHTSAGCPVIWVTPVGPMGHYPLIAELFNHVDCCVNPKLIFPFAMDEWASRDGLPVDKKEYPYMTSFKEDMEQQFYGRFAPKMRIPEANRHFAAGKGLRQYEADMDKLLAQGAGVIFTGGVGKIGHIMFWESTFGVRLGKALAEKVLWVRGAPLTYGTIDQNETTSSGSAPVPAFANTIGLGLFVKLRKYGERNPGRVHAYFGLDNDEEPLKWQRFIAQCMLAMEAADPSFGGSYVPTLPGAYILVRSHVEKNFCVASK